jgi:transcription elongation factor GreA
MEKIPMTPQGFAALEAELKRRHTVERPSIILAIQEARAHGDLSENAEYSSAKEAQSHNEGRIKELESVIGRAEIIDIAKMSGDMVKFGAKVTLIDCDTDEEKIWQIVGDYEANASEGRISLSSPIARALIGKKKGMSTEVRSPRGVKTYEIGNVSWS